MDVVIDEHGQSNWLASAGTDDNTVLPRMFVQIDNAAVCLIDERRKLRVCLPNASFESRWESTAREYRFTGTAARGSVQQDQRNFPLDNLALKGALTSAGLHIQSLRVASGGSTVDMSGVLSAGARPVLDASATLTLDAGELARSAGLGFESSGIANARVVARGPLDAPLIDIDLGSDGIGFTDVHLSRPAMQATLDSSAGHFTIRNFSTQVFSGELRAKGTVCIRDTECRSEMAASLNSVNTRLLARALGATGVASRTAGMRVTASWNGLDWRLARVSGVAQSSSANISFAVTSDARVLRASLKSLLRGSTAVEGRLDVGLADKSLSGNLRGSTDRMRELRQQIAEHIDKPPAWLTQTDLDGAVQWTAALGGTLVRPRFSITAAARSITVDRWRDLEFDLAADYNAGRLAIGSASLKWQGQRLTAQGEIAGISARSPLRLHADIQDVSFAPLLGNLGYGNTLEGSAAGNVWIGGTVGRPDAVATLNLGHGTAFGEQFSTAGLKVHLQQGASVTGEFFADQNHSDGSSGRVEANGSLNIDTKRYTAEVSGEDLRPVALRLPGDLQLGGAFGFKGQGSGTLEDPTFHIGIDGREITVGSSKVGEVHASLEAAGDRATVLVDAPALHVRAKSLIGMAGLWPLEFTLDAKDTKLDLPGAPSVRCHHSGERTARTTGRTQSLGSS